MAQIHYKIASNADASANASADISAEQNDATNSALIAHAQQHCAEKEALCGYTSIQLPKIRQTLAQAVYLHSNVMPVALCGGVGRCGKCRMRITRKAPPPCAEETLFFSEKELAAGWRLGCKHLAEDGMFLELPPQEKNEMHQSDAPPNTKQEITDAGQKNAHNAEQTAVLDAEKKLGQDVGLAVDLGTTTLYWQFLPLPKQERQKQLGQQEEKRQSQEQEKQQKSGKIKEKNSAVPLASGSALNPQMGAGSDVMSRLSYARNADGQACLQQKIVDFLRHIIAEYQKKHSGTNVRELCIAGNSVMTHLLLNLPLDGLFAAPYSLHYKGGDVRYLALPPAYIPPLLAPFVGADISAGMASILYGNDDATPPQYPFLLADMGTNGEFVLALNEQDAIVTSVALGPALEGMGLTHGHIAQHGVITHFALSPNAMRPQAFAGQNAVHGMNNGTGQSVGNPLIDAYILNAAGERVLWQAPTLAPSDKSEMVHGISGTGYLSLLALLLRTGVLDSTGAFVSTPPLPLGRKLAAYIRQNAHGETEFTLPCGFSLRASDIEDILQVKAAFSLAFARLLCEASLSPRELQRVYLAGSLGQYAPVDALETLGFVPPNMAHKIISLGNSSLVGAGLLLQDEKLRDRLAAWSTATRHSDLSQAADFMDSFMRNMRFLW